MAACKYFRLIKAREIPNYYECYCLRQHKILLKFIEVQPHFRERACGNCIYQTPRKNCDSLTIQDQSNHPSQTPTIPMPKNRFSDLIE